MKEIEAAIHTGEPPYPVERTLIRGSILNRAMASRFDVGKKPETLELAIAYTLVDDPHAPEPDLLTAPPYRRQ